MTRYILDHPFTLMLQSGSWVKEKSQFWPHLATLMNSLQNQTQVFQLNATQITQIKSHPLSDGEKTRNYIVVVHFDLLMSNVG